VFVTDELMDELKRAPITWLGPELAREATHDDPRILSPKQIQRANSGRGLNLVVWDGIKQAPHAEQRDMLDMELMKVFAQDHYGFQIKEMICQPLELGAILVTANTGMHFMRQTGEVVTGSLMENAELVRDPFLFFYDRDLAKLHPGSWASALLSCARPRIFFRLSEQRLLRAALRGLTDEELPDDLAVSLSAVKKSWRAIYLRAGKALPSQFPDIVNQDAESRRGKEKSSACSPIFATTWKNCGLP
jgi:hypothetical protein